MFQERHHTNTSLNSVAILSANLDGFHIDRGSVAIPHTEAGYRRCAGRLAGRELHLGGGRELALQSDLCCRVNSEGSGSTRRREWQFGEDLAVWAVYSLDFSNFFLNCYHIQYFVSFFQLTFQLPSWNNTAGL